MHTTMDNDSLKAQFNLLQQQQRQKLQRRSELKAREENKYGQNHRAGSSTAVSDSLWASEAIENLELQLNDNSNEELNEHSSTELIDLRERARELTDENGRLYKLLKEREEELKITKRRWQEEKKELTGQTVGADGAAKKIIDLSKKNRELNVEVEKERNKCSQLEKKVKNLEMSINSGSVETTMQDNASHKDENQGEGDVKQLQDKLTQSTNKVSDMRIQVDNLKEELKVAHKIIAKEVGEGVSIQSLLGGSSNWKGRQQQIIQLQNKVSELQVKVGQFQQPRSLSSSAASFSSIGSMTSSIHEEKYKALLKKIELERKDVVDKQQSDLQNLEKEFKKMKEKFDASKARNNVLSIELKGLKSQMSTLKDKGKHDDELISVLLLEQTKLKDQIERLKNKGDDQRNVVCKPKQDEALVTTLQEQVKTQLAKVAELEAEIQAFHGNSSKLSRQGKNSARGKGKQEQQQMQLRRGTGSSMHSSGSEQSVTVDEVNEYKTKLQEIKSFQQVAEVERDRLLELVQVLERKIDDSSQNSLKMKEELIEMKRKNAKLEKQIERLQSSNARSASGFTGNVRPRGSQKGGSTASTDTKKSQQNYVTEIEDLETRLGIQIDTNDALKEALESTLKSKEADMKFYQDMLEQTKKIFLNGLKEFKQSMVTA